jgi:DNA primase catalytic subunit
VKLDNTTENIKKELEEFYANNLPDVSTITDLNKRHFRMVLPSGRFLKIPDIIRNQYDLQKWLLRLKPIDVYYSTSTWLNPTEIKPRPKKRGPNFTSSGILLYNDIIFDIDINPLSKSNLDRARLDTLKVLDHLESNGYRCKYIAFSGSKGFHLAFEDHLHMAVRDPFDREQEIIDRRKKLVNDLDGIGQYIDGSVTCDTRRIVRVPGTINSKTGIACTILSRPDLEVSINVLIRTLPALPSAKKVPHFNIPGLKTTRLFPSLLKILQPKNATLTTGDENRQLQIGYYYTTYLQSNVLGIRSRHSVLLSFQNRPMKKIESQITELIEEFKLTDVYLFRLPSRTQAISLKSVQRNRLQKILDQAHADNTSLLRKYNVTSIRVGPFVNEQLEELEPPIQFVKTITSVPEVNDSTYISSGHLNFLQKNSIHCYDYPRVHGSGEFKVVDAVIKL